jgi:hypothetical protein
VGVVHNAGVLRSPPLDAMDSSASSTKDRSRLEREIADLELCLQTKKEELVKKKEEVETKEEEIWTMKGELELLRIASAASEPEPWRPNTRPKLQPGALLDIDQGPLYDILTEWLPMEAVCHLDSALCQKWRRAEFLALVSTKVLLFNREPIVVLTVLEVYSHTHRALGAAALNWVLKRGIHLASLHLPRFFKTDERQSISDAVASLALNGRLDKLETISLYRCYYIEDADLAAILSKCYNSAKSIEIRGCWHMESSAAHIKRCTKLVDFAARGNESAADMVEICQSCRNLRNLYLRGFGRRLTDEMVQSVAAQCPLLERLDLFRCSAVTDAVIREVAESCPLMQYIDIFATKITDATVVSMCKHCPLLKRMFLGCCDNSTDAAVLAVAERLSGLTHIDMGYIAAITSSALESLASKCRELEYINLSGLPNVSDVTLAKIAEHCSKLEDLNVTGRNKVTAVA